MASGVHLMCGHPQYGNRTPTPCRNDKCGSTAVRKQNNDGEWGGPRYGGRGRVYCMHFVCCMHGICFVCTVYLVYALYTCGMHCVWAMQFPFHNHTSHQRLSSITTHSHKNTQGAGVTEEGGVLWLPGNVAVELVMVPNPKDNGAIAARKGLRISSYYVSAKEQVHVLSREYAPDGELVEVRSRTAVKGNGWVGGAM